MNPDIIVMISNLSKSFLSFERLISGLAYVLGIFFIIKALTSFNRAAQSNSHESKAVPFSYLAGGCACLFFPNVNEALKNSVFGAENNILGYQDYSPYSIYQSMNIILGVMGGIFFIKGCSLLMHPPTQDSKHSIKGIYFLIASVFALNFNLTTAYVSDVVSKLAAFTMNSGS